MSEDKAIHILITEEEVPKQITGKLADELNASVTQDSTNKGC